MNSKTIKVTRAWLVTFFTILFTLSFCFIPAAIANKFIDDFDFWIEVAYNII